MGVLQAWAQRPRAQADVWRQLDQQEKHIDNDDREIQSNRDRIEQILVRIEGDEDYAKGAIAVVVFLQTLGLIKTFKDKTERRHG